MQITETNAEGLKHEFKVVVASSDIEQQIKDRLTEIGRSVRLPGFRPGKVPMTVLKSRYGSSVMGEVLERAVNDSSSEAIRERGLRPALQPRIEIVSFNEGADLEYKMAVEVLPDITPVAFDTIEIERLRPEVPDADIDKALERIAQSNRKSEPVERPAEKGDAVVIDFLGKLDGTPFPGGEAKDYTLELGSGNFIPGFEDQLVGAKAGDHRAVEVGFPEDYGSDDLAGKAAQFDVDVKEVRAFQPAAVDEELAKAVGMDSLEEVRKVIRERLERDYGAVARQRLKRALLDQLAVKHDFPVPAGMVDAEFETIWKQYETERAQGSGESTEPEDAGKDEETLKREYREIAERRVRLGLLLAEIGRTNNIQVGNEEVNRALMEEARRHPGYERQVVEFYRNQPEALAQLRAPIFEDKVIDFIVEMAKVTDKPISPAELLGTAEGEGEGEPAKSDNG